MSNRRHASASITAGSRTAVVVPFAPINSRSNSSSKVKRSRSIIDSHGGRGHIDKIKTMKTKKNTTPKTNNRLDATVFTHKTTTIKNNENENKGEFSVSIPNKRKSAATTATAASVDDGKGLSLQTISKKQKPSLKSSALGRLTSKILSKINKNWDSRCIKGHNSIISLCNTFRGILGQTIEFIHRCFLNKYIDSVDLCDNVPVSYNM